MHVQGLDYLKFLRDRSRDLWDDQSGSRRALVVISLAADDRGRVPDKVKEYVSAELNASARPAPLTSPYPPVPPKIEGIRCVTDFPFTSDLFVMMEAKTPEEIEKAVSQIAGIAGVAKAERRTPL